MSVSMYGFSEALVDVVMPPQLLLPPEGCAMIMAEGEKCIAFRPILDE
jgi:hypothetical protein